MPLWVLDSSRRAWPLPAKRRTDDHRAVDPCGGGRRRRGDVTRRGTRLGRGRAGGPGSPRRPRRRERPQLMLVPPLVEQGPTDVVVERRPTAHHRSSASSAQLCAFGRRADGIVAFAGELDALTGPRLGGTSRATLDRQDWIWGQSPSWTRPGSRRCSACSRAAASMAGASRSNAARLRSSGSCNSSASATTSSTSTRLTQCPEIRTTSRAEVQLANTHRRSS